MGFYGGVNFYTYSNNNPIAFIDPWGLYTWGYAETSLIIRGVTPDGVFDQSNDDFATGNEKYYTDEQIFKEWMRLERGDDDWIEEVRKEYQCPPKIELDENCKPKNPDSEKWNKPGPANREHEPAVWEIRSFPTDGGHANQCTYDACGKIMKSIPAAGSADRAAFNPWWPFPHSGHDLMPWLKAKDLGDTIIDIGGKKLKATDWYYKVRPSM